MTQVIEEKPETMPIDPNNACPVCGHLLRDHEFMANELYAEVEGVEKTINAWIILCTVDGCEHTESPAAVCFQSVHSELIEDDD